MSLMMYVISVLLGLINITRFFTNCYFGCGSNHMYCDLVEPFLQSAFCPCYLWCGSNRSCLENFLGGEVSLSSTSSHHYGCSTSCLYINFIIWLLKGSLVSPQCSSTIFPSTWCHIKDGPSLYFVALCVSIGLRVETAYEIDLEPWYQVGGCPHFSVENGKVHNRH